MKLEELLYKAKTECNICKKELRYKITVENDEILFTAYCNHCAKHSFRFGTQIEAFNNYCTGETGDITVHCPICGKNLITGIKTPFYCTCECCEEEVPAQYKTRGEAIQAYMSKVM